MPLLKFLVELHGGTPDIENELGSGANVTLRVPATRTLEDENAGVA